MFTIIFFLVGCVSVLSCAKILCVFPIPSISHLEFHQTICKELSLKGHQVTVLTPRPLNEKNLTNLNEIELKSLLKIAEKKHVRVKMMSKDNYDLNVWSFFANCYAEYIEEVITQMMSINQTTDIDLLIVESLHPLIYSLGCKFKTPIVALSSAILTRFAHDAFGNFQHPLVYFDILKNVDIGIGIYEKMRRLVNSVVSRIYHHWILMPQQNIRSKNHFGSACASIEDIQKNVSLVVTTTSPILNSVRPNVPLVIEAGSFTHIRPKKPLPQDLQTYLDQSPQGVVYFSLGTAVKPSVLSETFINTILQAFAELPYNVLFKWENDDLPFKPKNVVVRKWFPQQDILGHENINVFVTQGGLQSIQEAVANCVPLVGIPFYLDQPFNVVQLVKLGIARGIDYNTVTKDGLKEAIIEVAENETYKRRVQQVKYLLQDQPLQSLDTAIWWIEYVLRRRGARHLKSMAADLPWFEYFLLDLVAVVVIVVITALLFCFLLIK